MADGREEPSGLELGVYGRRPETPRLTATEVVAGGLSALWLLATGVFFLLSPPSGGEGPSEALTRAMVLMAVVLPIALIWVAALAVRMARTWREDAARLQAAVDALRAAQIAQAQAAGMVVRPAASAAPARGEAATTPGRAAEPPPATFVSRREAPGAVQRAPAPQRPVPAAPPAAPAEAQPSLALDPPDGEAAAPLDPADFIRALNFPDTPEDREGFRALRRALADREAARLIRASQDLLTLLANDGIYMDDLIPDRARPEVWRRFAAGERGRAIADLGGIRDRSSLALTAARMKQDVIFRDAAHHFLRNFDRVVSAFVPGASDADIAALAETRTARAFMLIGRVSGTFD
jgi:hypothetical protein